MQYAVFTSFKYKYTVEIWQVCIFDIDTNNNIVSQESGSINCHCSHHECEHRCARPAAGAWLHGPGTLRHLLLTLVTLLQDIVQGGVTITAALTLLLFTFFFFRDLGNRRSSKKQFDF